MFRADPHSMRGRPGALCLVIHSFDPDSPDGGAHNWLTAHLLAGKGWRVHVLYCGDVPARPPEEAGIGFSRLDDFPAPPHLERGSTSWPDLLLPSERVRFALEELDRRHAFDLVEFSDGQALGFRALQARRAGLAFSGLRMLVKLHGPSPWRREQARRWQGYPGELELDYAERYAFEQADFQASADPGLLAYARKLGWQVREDARVMPPSLSETGAELETVKAYQTFLETVCQEVSSEAREHPLVTVAVPYYNLGAYLPEALASLAGQTYPNLEVLVINDGSTDPWAVRVFEEQRRLYPQYHFLEQENAGIGATRNRGLREARGEFFIPMDADNVAYPHMVERFVAALRRNPGLAAMTCYFLAFGESAGPVRGPFRYACRPTGGPRVMAGFHNVYGDANAVFRTECFRAAGGYETDRDTSWEDWEAFVKLVNAGYQVDVIPDYLFAYRHREAGFSRVTRAFSNYQRVLRQVYEMVDLPRAERVALWTYLVSLQKRQEELNNRIDFLELCLTSLRYRAADLVHAWVGKLPLLTRGLKHLLLSTGRALQRVTLRGR